MKQFSQIYPAILPTTFGLFATASAQDDSGSTVAADNTVTAADPATMGWPDPVAAITVSSPPAGR